jgi:DNA-binding response OmpR family regulator
LKRILLIHGKPEQNFEFQNVLESAGFNTYITVGESDGLKIADRYMPDIMICDLDNSEKELGVIKRGSTVNSVKSY